MPQIAPLNLPWPLKGIDKSRPYRDQDAFTTKSALNVRNVDVMEGRIRGGPRPGLAREYETQLGSGNPIKMLGRVAVAKDANRFRWLDDFNRDSLGTSWTTASWIGTAPATKASLDGAYADNATNGASAPALNFLSTSPYTVRIYIAPWMGTFGAAGCTFSIFARMDSTPVATTNGIVAALTLTGATGVYSGSLTSYVSGVATVTAFSTGNITAARCGWFEVYVNTNAITCSFAGVTLCGPTTVSAHTGTRVGFGLSTTQVYPAGLALIDCFEVVGAPLTAADSADYTEHVCALSNGILSTANAVETFATVDANTTCASDRVIRCVENYQKLYVADWAEPRCTIAGVTVAEGGISLTKTAIDWSSYGINTYTDIAVVTVPTGSVAACARKIVTVGSGAGAALVLDATVGGAGSCTVRIARAPKVWDPSAATFSILYATSGKGQVPNENPLITAFQDRIILAGASTAPQVWYAARKGSAGLDWDYGQTDVGRAVAGTDDTGAGTIGLPLTAIWAASDDNCVMAAKTMIACLRGDVVSGQFDTIDPRIGVVGKGAYCHGPGHETYFLSRDGVYMLPPGEVGQPKAISRKPLPMELLDIDTNLYDILMAYNMRQQGVHIWLSYKTGVPVYQWYYDTARDAWWQDSYSSSHEVFSALALQVNTVAQSEILLGCRDGYIRRYSTSSHTDDGTAISSYCYLGPVRLGGDDFNTGLVNELEAIIDRESGGITWSLYTGDTHEDAWNAASAASTGTWSAAGLQLRSRPMAGGGSAILKLSNYGNQPWALERVIGQIHKRGRHRLG